MSGSTLAAFDLPPREAIAFFRQKTRITTQHWTDVWREGHSRGFMVAGAATDALVADFQAEVARALEQGTTLAEFRKGFDAIVARHGWVHNGAPGWRARIIYETNLATAYSAGRYAQMTEPDTLAAFPYWQYVHSGAAHPRKQHQAWNGLVLRADDPFWKTHYPPNGWRCGCRVRPLSARDLARQGKAGPDAAPPIATRPWTNPRTGEVMHVPVGIDPGFDYNPGQAWQGGTPPIPADACWTPPAHWPPPAPGVPRPATRAAQQAAEPDRGLVSVRLDDGPARPDIPIPPPSPEAGLRAIAAEYRAWLEAREAAGFRPDGTSRIVGRLSETTLGALRARGRAPQSAALEINAEQLRHLTRDVKKQRGQAIALEDLRRLPELLAAPDAVLLERATGNLVMVFTPSSPAEMRRGKLIVHIDFHGWVRDRSGARQRRSVNAVKSGGLVPAAALRQVARYELIEGKV